MLFAVDHRLGDSRKSACGVGAPRLFCFNAGFSGSPNGILTQAVAHRSIRVHKPALSFGANLYARCLTGVPVHDMTAGFVGYQAELLRKIDLTGIRSEGYAFL